MLSKLLMLLKVGVWIKRKNSIIRPHLDVDRNSWICLVQKSTFIHEWFGLQFLFVVKQTFNHLKISNFIIAKNSIYKGSVPRKVTEITAFKCWLVEKPHISDRFSDIYPFLRRWKRLHDTNSHFKLIVLFYIGILESDKPRWAFYGP